MMTLAVALALSEPARAVNRSLNAENAAIEALDAIASDEPTQMSSLLFDGSDNRTDWRVFSNKHDCSLTFGGNFDSHHLSIRFDANSRKSILFIDDVGFWPVETGKRYQLFVSYELDGGRKSFREQFTGKKGK